MKISSISSQPSRYIDPENQVRPIELPCRYHSGSVCLNYCQESDCFKLLCEECIEEHLQHHKRSSLSILSIKSFKKVRENCVHKLNKLIEDLISKISGLKSPKSPQQMLQQSFLKFQNLKQKLFEIVEQEISRFYEDIKLKINESITMIKGIQEIHNNFSTIIEQLRESKSIIIEGTPEITKKIEEVIMMNQKLYVDAFEKQSAIYMQKLAHVDFDISLNESKFRSSISQSLKITRKQSLSLSPSPSSKTLSPSLSPKPLTAQSLRIPSEQVQRYLHWLPPGTSILRVLDLQNRVWNQFQLNGFIVPEFCASTITDKQQVFISGGMTRSQQKSPHLSKFSLKSPSLKPNFSSLRPRSSHTLCPTPEHLYVVGGYGEKVGGNVQISKWVERVDVRTGEVEDLPNSRFGGVCMAVALKGNILKASLEGVEMFDGNQWATLRTQNFIFYQGCGMAKLNDAELFVYGGYDQEQEGVDFCYKWEINTKGVTIVETGFRLPQGEGFQGHGAIWEGKIYDLVDGEEVEEDDDGVEEKNLICFDGVQWRKIQV